MKISEIPFEPVATPAHIETALAFFDDEIEKVNVGNYRIVKGRAHTDYIGKPCHANLGDNPGGSVRKCVALYTGSRPDTEKYRKWLWEESFIKRFVLAIHEKGAVIDGNIPAVLMQNIGIMSRHCLEFSSKTRPCFPMFNELYDKIGGELAYVLSFNTSFNAMTLEQWWSSAVLNGGAFHRAWPLFQLKSLQNFLNGDFHFSKGQLKRPWCNYAGLYGGAKLCEAVHDYTTTSRSFVQDALEYEEIRGALSEYRKTQASGEAYRPPNPFKVNPSVRLMRTNDATFREVVDCLIPAMMKKGLIP